MSIHLQLAQHFFIVLFFLPRRGAWYFAYYDTAFVLCATYPIASQPPRAAVTISTLPKPCHLTADIPPSFGAYSPVCKNATAPTCFVFLVAVACSLYVLIAMLRWHRRELHRRVVVLTYCSSNLILVIGSRISALVRAYSHTLHTVCASLGIDCNKV